MLSMLNKCMTSVGSYIGTLVPSSVIVTLTKHVQILGEAYSFRELLPLNFFLTAVRAWRPLVHLFVFVFERQCIYMAKILHPFKCKVQEENTLSHSVYRFSRYFILLCLSFLIIFYYFLQFVFAYRFVMTKVVRKIKNHKIKYFNFVPYSV